MKRCSLFLCLKTVDTRVVWAWFVHFNSVSADLSAKWPVQIQQLNGLNPMTEINKTKLFHFQNPNVSQCIIWMWLNSWSLLNSRWFLVFFIHLCCTFMLLTGKERHKLSDSSSYRQTLCFPCQITPFFSSRHPSYLDESKQMSPMGDKKRSWLLTGLKIKRKKTSENCHLCTSLGFSFYMKCSTVSDIYFIKLTIKKNQKLCVKM